MYVPMAAAHIVSKLPPERSRSRSRSPRRTTTGVLQRLRISRAASTGRVRRAFSVAVTHNPSRVASTASNRGSMFRDRLNTHSLRRNLPQGSEEASPESASNQDNYANLVTDLNAATIDDDAPTSPAGVFEALDAVNRGKLSSIAAIASGKANIVIAAPQIALPKQDDEELSLLQALLSTDVEAPESLIFPAFEPTLHYVQQKSKSQNLQTDVPPSSIPATSSFVSGDAELLTRTKTSRPTQRVAKASGTKTWDSSLANPQDLSAIGKPSALDEIFSLHERKPSLAPSGTSSMTAKEDLKPQKPAKESTPITLHCSFPVSATIKKYDFGAIVQPQINKMIIKNPNLAEDFAQLNTNFTQYSTNLQQEMEDLQADNSARLAREKELRARLKQQFNQSQALLADKISCIDGLESQNTGLYQYKSMLQQKISRLESELRMEKALNDSIADALSRSEVEKAAHEMELESLRDQLDDLRFQNHELQYLKEDLQNQAERHQEEMRNYHHKNETLQSEKGHLQNQIDIQYAQIQIQKGQNDCLHEEIEEQVVHIRTLKRELQASKDICQDLEQELRQDVLQSLRRAQRNSLETNKEIQRLERILEKMVKTYTELKDERDCKAIYIYQLEQGYAHYRSYWTEHDKLYRAYFRGNHAGRAVNEHGVAALRNHYLSKRQLDGEPLNPMSGTEFLNWIDRNSATLQEIQAPTVVSGDTGRDMVEHTLPDIQKEENHQERSESAATSINLDGFPMPPLHYPVACSTKSVKFILGGSDDETEPFPDF
ncbi:unnamed protein product [Sphagnum balticum]